MKVSVFGLGYVGSVSAASFAADGHTVVGVDVNPEKVATLEQGRSPIVETGLEEMIRDGAAAGRLRATTSPGEAVHATGLQLGSGSRLGSLGQAGVALVQPGADVVRRVGAALALVAGQHGTRGGDAGEAGQSEQLPGAHAP